MEKGFQQLIKDITQEDINSAHKYLLDNGYDITIEQMINRLEVEPYVRVVKKKTNYIGMMSPQSIKLLVYIQYELELNTNYVELNVKSIKAEANMSEVSIYNSIKELGELGIISKRFEAKNSYWVSTEYLNAMNIVEIKLNDKTLYYDAIK
jgi:hypothetical protein